MLGKGVADKMQVGLNDVVQVTTAAGDRTLLEGRGIYQSGLSDLDKVQCYASLKTTQKLLGGSSSYLTDIQVNSITMELAPELAKVSMRHASLPGHRHPRPMPSSRPGATCGTSSATRWASPC